MADKLPIYEDIKRGIKERIRRGELKAGDRVPSEHELVNQLGVSRNQTRQALRELEIEGYVVRRRGSGSFVAPDPRPANATMLGDAPRTVTVAFPHYATRYIHLMSAGFMRVALNNGLGVTQYAMQLNEEGELQLLENAAADGSGGLVVWLGNETEQVREALLGLVRQGKPLVLADRYFPDVDETDYVASDNELIGYRLAAALLERGHRRIAIASTAFDTASSVALRIAGCRRAFEEAGLAFEDHISVICVDAVEPPTRAAAVSAAMAVKERPTAFLCINDLICRWVHEELTQLGYAPPDDVALASVDDSEGSLLPRVPVLTIQQQGRRIGEECARLLLSRIEDPYRPAEHVLVAPGPIEETVGKGEPIDLTLAP